MSNILDKIKLSGVTYDLIDSTAIHSMDGYWTSGQTTDAITAATAALAETVGQELSGKADVSDVETLSGTVTAHTSDTTIHVTPADKEAWNAKISSGDVASLFGNVAYDSNSKHINFYHDSTGGTVLAYIDATDFIKDGMVDNVEIKDVTISGESVTCLVITFNTDAGKEEIDIPISNIFDASNYYNKSEVDSAISAATSGKVDTTAFTAYSAATESAMTEMGEVTARALNDLEENKQDELVSGTNIKTINGNSILGSGDITVQTLPTISGTTLVFS